MEKKTKIIVLVTVLLAGLGVGAYFMFRKKPTDTDTEDDNIPDVGVDPNLSEYQAWKLGYLSNRDTGKHAVHLVNRPYKDTIVSGDTVRISGTSGEFDGDFTVSSVWIDASNNVGAVYLPIPYTPNGNTDRSFENEGMLELIK